MNIDWASYTRPQHEAVFDVLAAVHADTISRIRVGEGIDNTPLFALATDINNAMHAGNDDLARREHRYEKADCDCGVCP